MNVPDLGRGLAFVLQRFSCLCQLQFAFGLQGGGLHLTLSLGLAQLALQRGAAQSAFLVCFGNCQDSRGIQRGTGIGKMLLKFPVQIQRLPHRRLPDDDPHNRGNAQRDRTRCRKQEPE